MKAHAKQILQPFFVSAPAATLPQQLRDSSLSGDEPEAFA
jgi:hypothetical protein